MGIPVMYSITKYGRPCGVEPASKTLAILGWSISASVEDFGDTRVVHKRQRLPLGLETRHYFARVHAGLDQLKGDAAAHGLLLLGQPPLAHAALADWLEQLMGADHLLRLPHPSLE